MFSLNKGQVIELVALAFFLIAILLVVVAVLGKAYKNFKS